MASDRLGIVAGAITLGAREADAKGLAAARGSSPVRGLIKLRLADADEDNATLAVAAAREALAKADLSADDVGQVFLAAPAAVDLEATIAEAVGVRSCPVTRFAATPEAAADALLAAMSMTADRPSLIIAADDGRAGPDVPDAGRGAGAAAVVVDAGRGAFLVAERHGRGLVGQDPSAADLRPIVSPDSTKPPKLVVAPEATAGDALRVAHLIKLPGHETPAAHIGSLGCAAPLVALVDALSAADVGDRVLWVVPGASGWSAGLWEVAQKVAATPLGPLVERGGLGTDPAVADRCATVWARAGGAVAQGAFVSRQQFEAQLGARYRLEAQRCDDCSAVVFPPRESCPSCGSFALTVTPLSGRGEVYARTRIGAGGAPTEFAPLQQATGAYDVAIVVLAEGPRVAAMVASDGTTVAVGDEVALVFRLLYVQAGRPRYGFKARCIPSGPGHDKR